MTENKSLIGVDFFARDESRQTESISSDLSNWMSHAKGKSILGNSGNDRIPLYQEHHWVDLPQTQGSTRQTHMSIKELGSTSHNTCKDYRSYKKKKNSTYHDKQTKLTQIDNIFDIFVPAMRTTIVSPEFVIKLINIHKNNKYTEDPEFFDSKPYIQYVNTEGLTREYIQQGNNTLILDELMEHFWGLHESFIKLPYCKFLLTDRLVISLSKLSHDSIECLYLFHSCSKNFL